MENMHAQNEAEEAMLRALRAMTRESDRKLALSAVEDLAESSALLEPWWETDKITFFGSARLEAHTSSYGQVVELARRFSEEGFTIVTGGGPGIMTAGLEGAGEGQAVGIAISLPFETPGLHGFPTVIQDRFFTRKLAMVRHIRGFVAASGGFGTLDEVLEVLTLLQTGKKRPAPLVLLDAPERSTWKAFDRWVHEELVPRKLITPADLSLYKVTDDLDEAFEEVISFNRRFKSIPDLHPEGSYRVMVSPALTIDESRQLQAEFPDLLKGGITCGEDGSEAWFDFDFDHRSYGRLRQLIDAINRL